LGSNPAEGTDILLEFVVEVVALATG